MFRVPQGVVGLAGCYLLALGVIAAVSPLRAKRFLEAHVSTLRAHVLELALRVVVGAALVFAAPGMRGTTIALAGGVAVLAALILGPPMR